MNKFVVIVVIFLLSTIKLYYTTVSSVSIKNEEATNNLLLGSEEGETLVELYQNFTSLFDSRAILHFIQMKNETDPEATALLQSLDRYLRGNDAKKIVHYLSKDVEFTGIINYFYTSGFTNIYDGLKKISKIYGYDIINNNSPTAKFQWLQEVIRLVNKKFTSDGDGGGRLKLNKSAPDLIQQFLDTVLPMDNVRRFMETVSQVPASKSLHARLSDARVESSYRRLKELPEIILLGVELRQADFEIDTLRNIVENVIWEHNTAVSLRFDGIVMMMMMTTLITGTQFIAHSL